MAQVVQVVSTEMKIYLCAKYPGEGEACHNSNCAEGLYYYYYYICTKSPVKGKYCPLRICAEGLICAGLSSAEYKCWEPVGKEGEYCSV